MIVKIAHVTVGKVPISVAKSKSLPWVPRTFCRRSNVLIALVWETYKGAGASIVTNPYGFYLQNDWDAVEGGSVDSHIIAREPFFGPSGIARKGFGKFAATNEAFQNYLGHFDDVIDIDWLELENEMKLWS